MRAFVVFLLCASLLLLSIAFGRVPAAAAMGDEATPEQLAMGEKIFTMHCKSCHLEGGKSRIKRLNLADDRWMHGGTLQEIEQTVTNGVEASQMAPFKDKLNEKEIEAVAKYVLTLSQPQAAN